MTQAVQKNGKNIYVDIKGTDCIEKIIGLINAGYTILTNQACCDRIIHTTGLPIECRILENKDCVWERMPDLILIITNFDDHRSTAPQERDTLMHKISFLLQAITKNIPITTDDVDLDEIMEKLLDPKNSHMRDFGLALSDRERMAVCTMDEIAEVISDFCSKYEFNPDFDQ